MRMRLCGMHKRYTGGEGDVRPWCSVQNNRKVSRTLGCAVKWRRSGRNKVVSKVVVRDARSHGGA